MTTHRFDPVSAVLALIAIASGLAVAIEATDPFGDADAGIWLAVLALAVGFVLIPWGRRTDADAGDDRSGTEHHGGEQPGDAGVSDSTAQPERSDLVDLDT